MKNLGNAGHAGAYKMRKITAVEQQENHIHVCLECGHDYNVDPEGVDIKSLLSIMERYVGTQARCNSCKGANQ